MRERALRSLVHIRDALPRMCVHEGFTDGECVHIYTCMCVCVCVCVVCYVSVPTRSLSTMFALHHRDRSS